MQTYRVIKEVQGQPYDTDPEKDGYYWIKVWRKFPEPSVVSGWEVGLYTEGGWFTIWDHEGIGCPDEVREVGPEIISPNGVAAR